VPSRCGSLGTREYAAAAGPNEPKVKDRSLRTWNGSSRRPWRSRGEELWANAQRTAGCQVAVVERQPPDDGTRDLDRFFFDMRVL